MLLSACPLGAILHLSDAILWLLTEMLAKSGVQWRFARSHTLAESHC